MTQLLTAAQMRAIEAAAIERGAVSGLELMERAGAGVVAAIFEEWPELRATSHRAVVLCGPGNNGGDGFVVARLLREWGWEVEVFLFGDANKLPPDARTNHDRWCALGPVASLTGATFDTRAFPGACDLLVDGLFGTGLTRPVDLPLSALECAPDHGETRHTVAIDLPSGLCSDSGRGLGGRANRLRADLTVGFHTRKLGHVLADGPWFCGVVKVADIGLSNEGGTDDIAQIVTQASMQVDKSAAEPGQGAHKYTHGHALVLSGPAHRTGAARLAARGALRIGAGLVTVAAPGSALLECASQLTSIMLVRCDDAGALTDVLRDARITALCLGPGLGVDRARNLVEAALHGQQRALVLDADALTAFAGDPQALFKQLYGACVLTPHEGEFKRLFPDIHAKLATPAKTGPAFSKVDATRAAAVRAGCTVLLKGPDTVIASPNGRCTINSASYDRTVPWLATAGAGDVLAGFITGLLARGLAPHDAAATAAWLHVECARRFGPGLIAEDLPEQLPQVLTNLSA